MSEKKGVPELRFPEFVDEWNEERIEDSFYLVSGHHLKPDEYSSSGETPAKIPYFTGPSDFTNDFEEVSKWITGNGKIAVKGDILFTVKGSGVGSAMMLTFDKVAMGRQLMAIGSEKASKYFLFVQLESLKPYFIALASGNMIPGLSRNDILKTKLRFPGKDEQEKIAYFLSSVDQRIRLLQEKKAELVRYKKGVMQKIFSQEIRFKDEDGKEFPEWKERRLSQVFRRQTKKNIDDQIDNVLTNSATKGIIRQIDYFDHSVANSENLKGYYIVNRNDFVYNPRISTPAPVGPLNRNHNDIGVVSPLYTVLKCLEGSMIFFEYYFKSRFWHRYMRAIANYGARHDRMNISTNDLMNMPLPFPNILEQQKIASFLSAIDDSMKQVEYQIEQSKQFKKGLLQKMFV